MGIPGFLPMDVETLLESRYGRPPQHWYQRVCRLLDRSIGAAVCLQQEIPEITIGFGFLTKTMVGSHHSTSSCHSVLYDDPQNYFSKNHAGTQVDLNMTTTSTLPNTCMKIVVPVSGSELTSTQIRWPHSPGNGGIYITGYNPQESQEEKAGMQAWKLMHMLLSKHGICIFRTIDIIKTMCAIIWQTFYIHHLIYNYK